MRLARDGYHVLAQYRGNAGGAEETLTALRAAGGTGEVVQFDVRDRAAVDAALEKHLGTRAPAVLVNNAGITSDGLAGMMSDEQFDDVVRTNLYGAFYCLRWCSKRMLRERAGSIVNISSLAGQTGNAGQINYAASKAGLIAMTKSLAMELGPRGIRVNAVAPGLIDTEMLRDVKGLDEMKARIPLRRLGAPDEVAGVVSFLCSPDAGYITGHTLSVNGGLFPA